MSQRSGLGTVVSASRSAVAPGAMIAGAAIGDVVGRNRLRPSAPVRRTRKRELRGRGGLVGHGAADVHRRRVGRDGGRGDEGAPGNDVGVAGGDEADLAVDARAGIPARCGLLRIVHSHRDDVLAGMQMRRQFIVEADIAIGPVAEQLAVQVDVAVGHYAVEDDEHAARRGGRGVGGGNGEGLAVPADAGGRKGAGAARGRVLLEWPGDRPVVGQGDLRPCGVVEAGLLRAGCIRLKKAPARGELLNHARLCGVVRGSGAERVGKATRAASRRIRRCMVLLAGVDL